MQTEKNIWLRMLSMILTLALLISCVPSQVYALAGEALADMLDSNDSTVFQPNAVLDTMPGAAQIIAEDESRRGEMYKEYILSNGLRLATVYPSAIHYEVNGEWEDIDNSLVAVVAGEKAVFQNAAGAWNVQFPQSLSSNDMISITKDGYAVRFGITGELRSSGNLAVASAGEIEQNEVAGALTIISVQTATAQIQQIDLTAARAAVEYPETVLDKLNSRLTYENIYPNTNLVYDLQGNQLKESVILEQYNESLWGYRYTLDTGDLIPVLREDQRIDLCNPKTMQVVLTMPAPYMLDSNGEASYDVEVSLTSNGSNYLLSYYLPREWLADERRAWPVILDPVIEFTGIYTNVDDITVAENYNEEMGRGVIQCGYYSKAGAMRFYMQFLQLPTMASADVILDAKIRLNKPYDSGTTANVSVHKVTEEWSQSTISWTNQPTFETNIEDYVVCQLAGHYTWNITDMVRDWYETENYGMVFKAPSEIETAGVDNWKQFYSSDFNYSSNDVPFLTITYQNHNGLENYWDYTSVSAGRAGTGYIQNYSGNLVWVHSDMGFDGNRMPVSISHVYSTNDAASNRFGLGNGWRTNYHQIITQAQDDDGNSYYVWEDGDGTSHDFFANSEGVYTDIDNLGLTLTTTTTGYTITDKYDNTSNFDTSGRLISQVNNQATTSRILISYEAANSLRIKEILDGVDRKYSFSYENGLLSRIDFFGKGTNTLFNIQYGYTNSNLTTVTYKDGTSASFTYSAKNILLTATDIDGYKVSFGYNTLETNESSRVVSISESDNGTAGANMTLRYAYRCTQLTDHNGDTQTIFFNEWGNTISIQDSEGKAVFYQYDTAVNENGVKNRLLTASQEQNTNVNLISDSSFEGRTVWTVGSTSTSRALSSEYSYLGGLSLKSTCTTSGGAVGVTKGTYNVSACATYTFSAYVKTLADSEVKLRIADDTGAIIYSELLNAENDWTRLEVTYTNTTNAVRKITLSLYHTTAGSAYIDCAQLEQNRIASRYNMVYDGDLAQGGTWTYYSNGTVTPSTSGGVTAPNLSANRFYIRGDVDTEQYVYQTINMPGEAGDRYVFGGWAMGDSLPIVDGDRFFGLTLVFNNTDNTTTMVRVAANPNLGSDGQWQYLAAEAIADKPYKSITIRAEHSYNANTVYFDGLQLYKEEFGESYTYYPNTNNIKETRDVLGRITTYKYDAENNLTEVKQAETETVEYTYDDNDEIIATTRTGNVVTTYTYDAYHNVKTCVERYVFSDGGQLGYGHYAYDYDAYGNQIKQTITIGGQVKETMATYTNHGNHLYSTIDELENTTTYHYNADTSVLDWIRYPEDTEATRTDYTYDSMYRLVGASATTDQGKEMSTAYAYTDDVLTKISTKSTTYSFAYGDFALRTKVSVGNRTLATYTYSDDENKYLEKLVYGNNDVVEYAYDDLGRVIQEDYRENGSTTVSRTITYQYDNAGALATVKDSKTGITTKYYYDTVGRITGEFESGNSTQHGVRYTYDALGRVSETKEIYGNTTYETKYGYDGGNRVNYLESGDATEIYIYDQYGRLDKWYTYHNCDPTDSNTMHLIYKNIYYLDPDYDPDDRLTTDRIGLWNWTSTGGYELYHNYSYDKNGNITNDGAGTTYEYDSANQLIRENNQAAGKTWVWTYDGAGNILSKKEYVYTTGALGSVLDTITYTYGNATWGDLLTKYDGVSITYDSIGNPLSDGTWTYTWQQGRKLATTYNGSTTWTYTYDANGMRIKRTSGSTSYTYTYHGSQLTHMTYGSTALHFYYDASGSPLSVTYGGATYYYVLNLQGDVVAILNSSGVQVVGYTYDAWGRPLSTTGSMSSTLGLYNPLRYRGYVYDRETGLYYLQSRYYNPTWGRFISADSQLSTGDVIGLNLFVYCGNNPVNRVDPTGRAWYHWAIGAAIVAGFAIATVVTCGGFAAAATAVGLVSSGIALSSATATAVTAAFIGSAAVYGTAVIAAAGSSNSLQDFAGQGNWGTVLGTVFAAGLGVWDGYSMYRSQAAQYENAYNYSGGKKESYTQKRGWTDQSIRHAIHNGRQGATVNRAGEACTAYGYPGIDNQYVVINNSTRSIVQASNLYDPGWTVDDRIIWAP